MKKKKAYICSPLHADTPEEIKENMFIAKRYAKEVSQLLDCRADGCSRRSSGIVGRP